MNDVIQSIGKICIDIADTFQDQLIWQWDDRHNAVLATCQMRYSDEFHLSLKRHLKSLWDNSNTDDAPDIVLDAVSRFGGLMPGQVLFTSDIIDQNAFLCCAWWPWGDRETVSIRMAPYINNLSDEDKKVLNRKLQDWFRI